MRRLVKCFWKGWLKRNKKAITVPQSQPQIIHQILTTLKDKASIKIPIISILRVILTKEEIKVETQKAMLLLKFHPRWSQVVEVRIIQRQHVLPKEVKIVKNLLTSIRKISIILIILSWVMNSRIKKRIYSVTKSQV